MVRLTIKNNDGSYSQPTHTTFNKLFEKLSKLEDVLEKYGIENVEQLEQVLNWLSSLTGRDTEEMLFICQERKNIFERINFVAKENTELKEKLKNAIVLPNFKKGQEVFIIRNNEVIKANFQQFSNWIDAEVVYNPHTTIDDDGFVDVDYDFDMVNYEMVFATEEEARKRLEELNGE